MGDLFDDPEELGRRIGAARGYGDDSYDSFASKLGISIPTLRSYERGKLGDYEGSRELRRGLAEKVQREGEVPSWILGLSEPAKDRELGERIDLLAEAVERLAIQAMERDEFETFQQWWTSDPRYGEQGPEAENG